jgi:serine/threonine-protein kinase
VPQREQLEGVDAPEQLGPFHLLRELGSGAMGSVYLAEDRDEERHVALKVLHPHLLKRKGFFQRFQREALAGQRVEHPNVVRTLDCSFHVADGTPYCVLVMEYVKGRTLREMLREYSTLPEALVREIARQVAAGLVAIHAAGIVHRDLKPENVLITDDHRVRIMDLGVARHTELATELTQEGQFAGSLLYAAPEQLRGNKVTPAADLYALGVMLYELLSGTNPYRHDDPGAVITAHLETDPERLDRRTEEVSVFFSELIGTLLAKQPEERLADATVLGDALAEGERSSWWSARERTILRERERRPKVPVRRETKLYGRETELALCREAWERAKERHGNVLLLEGEAGIGKSRLVDAFVSDLDGADAHVLYGSYPPSVRGDGRHLRRHLDEVRPGRPAGVPPALSHGHAVPGAGLRSGREARGIPRGRGRTPRRRPARGLRADHACAGRGEAATLGRRGPALRGLGQPQAVVLAGARCRGPSDPPVGHHAAWYP